MVLAQITQTSIQQCNRRSFGGSGGNNFVVRTPMDSGDIKKCIADREPGPIKLHLGCGGERWRDFINVDMHPWEPCVGDFIADMRALGLPASSVDEIFTSRLLTCPNDSAYDRTIAVAGSGGILTRGYLGLRKMGERAWRSQEISK